MKKLYCFICGKYRKYRNPKIAYIFKETFVLCINYRNCGNEDEKNI